MRVASSGVEFGPSPVPRYSCHDVHVQHHSGQGYFPQSGSSAQWDIRVYWIAGRIQRRKRDDQRRRLRVNEPAGLQANRCVGSPDNHSVHQLVGVSQRLFAFFPLSVAVQISPPPDNRGRLFWLDNFAAHCERFGALPSGSHH